MDKQQPQPTKAMTPRPSPIALLHSVLLTLLTPLEFFIHDAWFALLSTFGIVRSFVTHKAEARVLHNQAVLGKSLRVAGRPLEGFQLLIVKQ
jgi:hypothetical protein